MTIDIQMANAVGQHKVGLNVMKIRSLQLYAYEKRYEKRICRRWIKRNF